MFRRDVKKIDGLLMQFLRSAGLETPLLQRRLMAAWGEVMGDMIAKYTEKTFIDNQTLVVKINNSALRAELSMMRSDIVNRLNQHVGARVIVDVRFC